MIFLFATFIVLGPDLSPISPSHGSHDLSHLTSYSDLEYGGSYLSETSAAIFCRKMKHQKIHSLYLIFKFCCFLNICHLRKAIHWENDPINRWGKLLVCLVRTSAMPSVKFILIFQCFSPSKEIAG
jgi:hypothetical protein